jgi:hypothetical protein
MSISQYSPDGKFESGSFMNGMWSGPQGTNPNQGLMGLGQTQQVQSPMGGLANRPPSQAQIADQQRANAMTSQFNAMTPDQQMSNFMGQPQGNMPQIGRPLGRFNPSSTLPDGTRNSEGGSYEYPQQPERNRAQGTEVNGQFVPTFSNPDGSYMSEGVMVNPQQPQRIPSQSFFEGPNAGRVPQGYQMVNGELVKMGLADGTGFNPMTPPPPQIFQTPMQPSNPVNTQTVQPNFLGQTPFGQPQTSQYSSSNPFVQAAQANAQGNLGGALQATAANRINQQTPYGSLSYQQTGTDAQGNPIWSANQQLSPELQNLTQSSLAGLQASQANPMYGINPGDTYSNAIMQRLAPQQSQAREALDAQLANQGIMPGSEAYNRAKTLLGQTQNDALTSAIVGGMQTGISAQDLQNKSAANIRNLATPGYVTPYNQAAVAGPDYLSAYTSQNATEIARQNAEAAQRSAMLGGLAGLGSSAILGGTGPNSALGGLYGLGSKGLEALGNTSLWNSLFGTGPAITGDQDFLKSIGLAGSTYGSGIEGMLTDPLAGLF